MTASVKDKRIKRERRHRRVRAKIYGTTERPRLLVFRSNRHVWTQLIDDSKGHTLLAATDRKSALKGKKENKSRTFLQGIKPRRKDFNDTHSSAQQVEGYSGKVRDKRASDEAQAALAEKVGEETAKKALEKKITTVLFDRGGYKYHGVVKAVAEGARKGGLKL